MKRWLVNILFLSACILGSCLHTTTPKIINPAFYYWKHDFKLDSVENRYLHLKGNPVMYIRFFDVGWDTQNAQPVPVAPIRFVQEPDSSLQYIPVVFITNETIQHCSDAQIETLANDILQKIKSISQSLNRKYKQVQMDCDWTPGTKDKYFSLLSVMHQHLQNEHILLSATIRLHQIKFADKTGIPPVDRGMLMAYNMGDWKLPQTQNSIYDLNIMDQYIQHLEKYPLALDIALPLLRWTIVYRNRKFLTFLNYVTADSLIKCDFLKLTDKSDRFVVTKDTVAFGCSFRRNDLLRSESCDFHALREGEKQLLLRIRNDSLSVTLFHLDGQLLKHYSYAQIQEIFGTVQ